MNRPVQFYRLTESMPRCTETVLVACDESTQSLVCTQCQFWHNTPTSSSAAFLNRCSLADQLFVRNDWLRVSKSQISKFSVQNPLGNFCKSKRTSPVFESENHREPPHLCHRLHQTRQSKDKDEAKPRLVHPACLVHVF